MRINLYGDKNVWLRDKLALNHLEMQREPHIILMQKALKGSFVTSQSVTPVQHWQQKTRIFLSFNTTLCLVSPPFAEALRILYFHSI